MNVFKESSAIAGYLKAQRHSGRKYGFVPTMGALHQGHLSLIARAKQENDLVICSVFVNPAQFNDPKDFELYPKTMGQDIELLQRAGCDTVFTPATEQLYPNGIDPDEKYEIGDIEFILEGKYRPGHYQGVCKVMQRLLHIVNPDRLYLGEKDFQQCLVIRKLLSLLNMDTQVVICPTRREPDGLAMSSRNIRLSGEQRQKATAIFRALSFIRENIRPGALNQTRDDAVQILLQAGFKIDYLEIVTVDGLQPVSLWDGKTKIIALAAAYMGTVRLIDNMELSLNFAPNAN